MFESIPTAPPDPILGVTEAFRKDPRPHKINLGVGVYQDARGETPIFEAVKAAERRLLEHETTKSYLPIEGHPDFGLRVGELVFGAAHAVLAEGRAVTLHTPGGTAALRVLADFVKAHLPGATVWVSDPTWMNHPVIFAAAGVPTRTYRYFDEKTGGVDGEGMLADLRAAKKGDVVLIHGGCHNPTGADLSDELWRAIGQRLGAAGLLPAVDFAYQGLAIGVEQDAAGLRTLLGLVPELAVCSSFSKNLGLYRERVGALTLVASTAAASTAVRSQLKVGVRRIYSSPAAHGGEIVRVVLGESDLRESWLRELAEMQQRIASMRVALAQGLDARGVALRSDGNAFITTQRGMFSYSGLGEVAVSRLREEHAVYAVGAGRINVAAITPSNVDALCDAIAAVRRSV